MAQQQPRRRLSGRDLQARFKRIPRSRPVSRLLHRLAQLKSAHRIFGVQFTRPLQTSRRFGEISGGEFKLTQLTERGRRVSVDLERAFEKMTSVVRSIVVGSQ